MGKLSFLDTRLGKWILALSTVIGGALGAYGLIHEKKPKLQYEIQSQIELFNKTEDIVSVQVLVDTMDVLASNKNIMYYVIRVKNEGNDHLRVDDYDEGPFGIQVNGGAIVQDATIGLASNSHIEERYRAKTPLTTESFVEIPKVSLDINDWYTITLAVLHDEGSLPVLIPSGKIIGQKKLSVSSLRTDSLDVNSSSLNSRNLPFPPVVFILLLIYFLILSLVLLWEMINDIYERKRDRILVGLANEDGDIPAFMREDLSKHRLKNIRAADYCYKIGEEGLNKVYQSINDGVVPKRKNLWVEPSFYSIYLSINQMITLQYIVEKEGIISIPEENLKGLNIIKEMVRKYDKAHNRRSWIKSNY